MRELTKRTTESIWKIQNYRHNFLQAQAALLTDKFNVDLVDRIKQLSFDLIKATNLEEQVLMKRVKVDWLLLRDRNNRYFHATLKIKNKALGIHALEDPNGMEITGHDNMEREVLRFYEDLIGKSSNQLRHINVEVLRNGAQLSHTDQNELIQPVVDKEIMAALKSIGDTKALEIDGYNAKLFMEAWEIIGKDVKAAVYDFFEHGRLYKAVNCTIVTLILKFPNANKMKDMRPIACCIVLYKIISKILTNRLSKVINIVVDYS
ncbi:uncharacterized protein LOC131614019 [Vicia villosa]|uniref:uncharacterized protein LOC131614019 n=1 Tax=Vicia villosa TaxID=3911 RepID=UPI00273AD85A|nr:uncharacterized protein LOC131614019 [Vicia villosa]